MRLITLALAALLILIQFPLWLGKGGWLRVADLEAQVEEAHRKNEQLKARNAKLESEVRDLKEGIQKGIGNSILIKINQIGTLTETFAAIEMAKRAGYTAVI